MTVKSLPIHTVSVTIHEMFAIKENSRMFSFDRPTGEPEEDVLISVTQSVAYRRDSLSTLLQMLGSKSAGNSLRQSVALFCYILEKADRKRAIYEEKLLRRIAAKFSLFLTGVCCKLWMFFPALSS